MDKKLLSKFQIPADLRAVLEKVNVIIPADRPQMLDLGKRKPSKSPMIFPARDVSLKPPLSAARMVPR